MSKYTQASRASRAGPWSLSTPECDERSNNNYREAVVKADAPEILPMA